MVRSWNVLKRLLSAEVLLSLDFYHKDFVQIWSMKKVV